MNRNKVKTKVILLRGGPPWGFRFNGGSDCQCPVRITRVRKLNNHVFY